MKILLIGLGRWGKNHLRVWNELNQDLYIAEKFESQHSLCELYKIDKNKITTDYKQFLDKVDAVSIVTPTDSHFEIIKDCINAGKDVFVEKPVCMTSAEAKIINDMVKQNQTILQVGHIFRFNPVSSYIKNKISSGELGNIRYMHGSFKGFKRARTDVGVTQTDSIHYFDLFNHFLGSRPKYVTAVTRDFLGRGLDDLSYVILEYNKTIAFIESSYFPPGNFRDVTIMGDKKSIHSKITSQNMEIHNKHHEMVSGVWQAKDDGTELPKITTQEPLYLELKSFIECVKTRKEPEANIESGYTTLKLVEAVYKSSQEGRKVEVEYENL